MGLKKIDVEVREILEEEEEKRILKEMGAKSIRHIKNDAGEIEETWIMWKEVDDVSSEGGDARVFHVDKQACKVAFGDGKHGKIPPSGTNNIRAIYTCEETE